MALEDDVIVVFANQGTFQCWSGPFHHGLMEDAINTQSYTDSSHVR